MRCERCIRNFIVSDNTDEFLSRECLSIHLINHCKEYDVQSSFNDSNLSCIICNDEYYLSNGICINRNNKNLFCEEFEVDADLCKECKANHYLSINKEECFPIPSGIFGCKNYESETDCIQCKSEYYLKDNVCTLVEVDDLISKCEAYNESEKCSKCAHGYFLKDNVCVEIMASGCKEVEDEFTCSSCTSSDYGLRKEEDLTNCVSKDLLNCLQSTDEEPFECELCSDGFFVDE